MEPVYALARGALKPLLRHGLRWTIEGGHRIPRHGPAIVASNHASYLDPLCLAYVVDEQGRRPRFLAKQELFGKRALGWALRQVHQIPVARGSGAAGHAVRHAVDALAAGEVVTIFPEGTISLDLDPMPGKTGTARLAQLSGVPVTPVGLWGSHRILFKGRDPNWQWGVPQVACVGEPVSVAADDDVREATDRLMAAVCAQVRRARELYPEAPEPGDDDWWFRPPETAVLRSCRAGEEATGQASEATGQASEATRQASEEAAR